MSRLWLLVGVVAIASLSIALAADPALAQASPFGAPRTQLAAPPDGIVGWLLAKQSEFYRGLSGAIRAAKKDGSAVWTLFALSFAYGVFHAAGPGHGKAVISSYVVANGETWWRGVVLSFASAILQAVVAVAIVGIAAVLLGATRRTMDGTVWWIEVVSYGLIAVLGARLLWVKGRALIASWRKYRAGNAAHSHGHGSAHANDHAHSHAHHDHAHHGHAHHHDEAHGHPHHGAACSGHHHHHGHDHDHDDHASAWGHAHAPEPQELAGPGGWTRGLSAIVAVGLRPCSGAILVLVFALAQGLFWAGVVSTFIMGLGTAITVAAIATLAVGARGLAQRFASSRPGPGMLVLRGLEVAAALLVLVFGIALLTGYIASERMFA
ncbi:nickel/cobalt transporter [Pseudorhodoplanes sp.]|uniref:nickel/cobalt transporter n=1 Tax=Pseudorhodoplanes sp. TaxID=1934341 RepID=UPI002B5D48A8|nr:nickel/cobalt transporter [Pseudorhodoplanes sp.]HWV40030.1 nickel/cobalt transporter [Pseudorhodoplanes sp.]